MNLNDKVEYLENLVKSIKDRFVGAPSKLGINSNDTDNTDEDLKRIRDSYEHYLEDKISASKFNSCNISQRQKQQNTFNYPFNKYAGYNCQNAITGAFTPLGAIGANGYSYYQPSILPPAVLKAVKFNVLDIAEFNKYGIEGLVSSDGTFSPFENFYNKLVEENENYFSKMAEYNYEVNKNLLHNISNQNIDNIKSFYYKSKLGTHVKLSIESVEDYIEACKKSERDSFRREVTIELPCNCKHCTSGAEDTTVNASSYNSNPYKGINLGVASWGTYVPQSMPQSTRLSPYSSVQVQTPLSQFLGTGSTPVISPNFTIGPIYGTGTSIPSVQGTPYGTTSSNIENVYCIKSFHMDESLFWNNMDSAMNYIKYVINVHYNLSRISEFSNAEVDYFRNKDCQLYSAFETRLLARALKNKPDKFSSYKSPWSEFDEESYNQSNNN